MENIRVNGKGHLVTVFPLVLLLALLSASCKREGQTAAHEGAASKEADKAAESAASEVSLTIDPGAQRNAGVLVESVRLERVGQSLRTTGKVAPNDTRVAHVRPLAGGRVQEVYVRLGDRVQAGHVLIAFDNIELGNAIGQYLSALAALKQARTQAEVTRRSAERAKNLVELGAIARAEMERRDAEYRNALAGIESKEADVAKVELTLRRFGLDDAELAKLRTSNEAGYRQSVARAVVRAPFSGIVTKQNVAQGEVIAPDTELMVITDLSTVWVLGSVYENDLGLVRQGAKAYATTASHPGKRFMGTITYVSDFLDPATRTANVRCEVGNHEGLLKLDMFTELEISTRAQREALLVSETAVQRIQSKTVVFVKLSDDRFEVREVQVGPGHEDRLEITAGLKPGDAVVTQGAFALKSQLLKSQIASEEEEEKGRKE
jgi:membrane fusion protein, heavy metal efflux system